VHVVSNSSPIILLSRIGLLDLLPRLYDRVTIPGEEETEASSS